MLDVVAYVIFVQSFLRAGVFSVHLFCYSRYIGHRPARLFSLVVNALGSLGYNFIRIYLECQRAQSLIGTQHDPILIWKTDVEI